jgi:hypothetical protein
MDYGSLVGTAWRTTRRNPYLWALGIFAGGAVGVGTRDFGQRVGVGRPAQWTADRGWERAGEAASTGTVDGGSAGPFGAFRRGEWRIEDTPERAQALMQGAADWAVANVGLLVAGAVVAVLLAAALLVLGLIARGAMAEATVDLASGQRSSLGRMWRTGTRLVWRYAGLWLVLAALGLVVASFVAGSVAFGVGAAAATGMPRLVLGFGALIGIPLAIAATVGSIALAITVAYAERAIYAEDAGTVEALKTGWRLLRQNLAVSAVVWLLNAALSIAAGFVIALGAMVMVGVLGALGAALWFATGWSAPVIAYGVLGAAAVAGALLTAGAVLNTFFWNYWSLAYVRLTGATGLGAPAHA